MAINDPDIGAQLSTGTGRAFFRPGVHNYAATVAAVLPTETMLSDHRTAIDLGEPQAGTMTIDAGTQTDTRTKRKRARDIIKTEFEGATRTIALSSLSIIKPNIALFLNGTVVSISQSDTAISDEPVYNVDPDTFFTLGRTTVQPAGIRGHTALSLKTHPTTVSAWAATTAYDAGDIVSDGLTGFAIALNSGTSGGVEPTWPGTKGDQVADNDITWEIGQTAAAATLVEDTDYEVDNDGTNGSLVRYIGTTAHRVLFADYTPSSVQYEQIATGERVSVEGSFLFIADWLNKESWWFAPKCTLVPTGDFSFVTESDTQQEVGFSLTLATLGSLNQLYYFSKAA